MIRSTWCDKNYQYTPRKFQLRQTVKKQANLNINKTAIERRQRNQNKRNRYLLQSPNNGIAPLLASEHISLKSYNETEQSKLVVFNRIQSVFEYDQRHPCVKLVDSQRLTKISNIYLSRYWGRRFKYCPKWNLEVRLFVDNHAFFFVLLLTKSEMRYMQIVHTLRFKTFFVPLGHTPITMCW